MSLSNDTHVVLVHLEPSDRPKNHENNGETKNSIFLKLQCVAQLVHIAFGEVDTFVYCVFNSGSRSRSHPAGIASQ